MWCIAVADSAALRWQWTCAVLIPRDPVRLLHTSSLHALVAQPSHAPGDATHGLSGAPIQLSRPGRLPPLPPPLLL